MLGLGMFAANFEAMLHGGLETDGTAALTGLDTGFQLAGRLMHGGLHFADNVAAKPKRPLAILCFATRLEQRLTWEGAGAVCMETRQEVLVVLRN
jgi:hypothetical protein